MEDIVQKIILDDSSVITGLTNMSKLADETAKDFNDLQKTSSNSAKVIGNDLSQGASKASKEIDTLSKSISTARIEQDKQVKAVSEIAVAFAKNKSAADNLALAYKGLKILDDVGLKDTAFQVDGMSEAFEQMAKEVGLTSDQLEILKSDTKGVIEQLKLIDSAKFKELADTADRVVPDFINVKKELKDLTIAINSGKLEGKELEVVKKRAAELTDRIGDARAEIKAMASDTIGIDTMIQGFQAMAAGVGIVQGSMALLGDENEDLKETLVKLNGIMVISQSLQQAHQLLYQETALSIKFAAVQQGIYNTVVGTSTGLMKAFRIALAATGVGLLVLAIGALVTNWDKLTESVKNSTGWIGKIGNAFTKLDSIAKGVMSGIMSVFENFGNVITNFFSGNFTAAIDSFKESIKGASDAFRQGFDENELKKTHEKLAKQFDQLAISSKRNAEIMNAAGKDSYKSTKASIEAEISALTLRNNDEEALNEKRHELRLLDVAQQKKINDEIAKENERRRKEREQMIKEFRDAVKEIQNASFEGGGITQEEYSAILQKRGIELLKSQRDELSKLGKSLGEDVSEYIKQYDNLIKVAESRSYEAITKPLETLKGKPIEIPEIKIDGSKLKVTLSEDPTLDDILGDILKGIEESGGLIGFLLRDAIFGENSEHAREFVEGANIFISQIGSILNEATDLQLKSIDKQLDKLKDRRKTLEDDLKNEQELFKLGLANNLESKTQEVDGLIGEEDRLQKEREKIQREAEQRQLIADTVQQTQSLITSSINIIKGFSHIPIVGLPLGIAAVATLLGFFAKTKAEAFKATRLHTGADRIGDYFGSVGTKSDIPGRGNGYKVVDSDTGLDTGVIIGGREMLIPERISITQKKFFDNLKKGRYDFDIAKALEGGRTVINSGSVVNNTFEMNGKQWVTYVSKGVTKARLLDIPKDGEKSVIIFND